MRRPTTASALTAAIVALFGTAAIAQVTARTGSATGTAGSTATATTTPSASSSSANASSAGANTAAPLTFTAPSETLPGQNVTSPATTASTPSASTNNATGTGTNTTASGNATGAVASGPGPTQNSTGPLVDIIEGSGTTVGTSATGSTTGTASATNGTGTVGAPIGTLPTTGLVNSFVIPGTATDLGALGDTGNGVNANGERVVGSGRGGRNAANNAAPANSLVSGPNVYTLPLYDATTKAATARELSRRSRGEEPRVIGMAPRTNNDLTWQMPDDRIIRY